MASKFNPLFIKMLACLLALVFVCAVAMAGIGFLSVSGIETVAVEKENTGFVKDAENLQALFYQIRGAMGEFSANLMDNRGFADASYVSYDEVRAMMRSVFVDRRQNSFAKYITTVFVRDLNFDGMVYELTGSYTTDVFFNQYYASEIYTDTFWKSGIGQGEIFEIYPADIFSSSREARRVESHLLPVAYKPENSGRYIVVMMLDADKILSDFGATAIYSGAGQLLYTSTDSGDTAVARHIKTGFTKTDDGYVFNLSAGENGLPGVERKVSGKDMSSATGGVVTGFLLIFFAFLGVGILGAVLIAYRYTAPIWQIATEINKGQDAEDAAGCKANTLNEICDGVKLCLSHAADYIVPADNKESVLNSIFLQSRMRDVYIGIDNIEEHVNNISKSFFMVYLRVNYKEEFGRYMSADAGKATFFLKQLIELYLENAGIDATTLQIENNGIVSVINAAPDFVEQKEFVKNVLSKLENESEYAYFTVAVSNVYENIENVKTVYDKLLDLSKYEKPIMETQIICEHDVRYGAGRFYFSVEDMGKLSAVIQNGSEEDALRKFEEIVDYNIKKEINGFELYLLCTEIVNCSVKLVNRVSDTPPSTLDISAVYRELNRAYTPERCKDICRKFLQEIMAYIRQNKREDDYIISYILDYVDNHYAEDIYLNLFAEKLKLTGAYISSYFKEKMNVNLSDYINNYRIKKALELSENPQNKNKDIAVMVGLPNINTFIRLFKKYTGYTPGEYRKKHFGDGYKNEK